MQLLFEILFFTGYQWRIQKILVGGGDLKHKTSKIRMSSPKLRVIFRPKSEIQTFFSPKFRWSRKKKKVFTKIETDFSPDSLRLGRWGGMHPEMEPNYSKQMLIFRPKSLLLGWWGGCIPPIPPPKFATAGYPGKIWKWKKLFSNWKSKLSYLGNGMS